MGLAEITNNCLDLAIQLIMDENLTNSERVNILNAAKRFNRSRHLQNACLMRSKNFIKPVKHQDEEVKSYYMPIKKVLKTLVDEDVIETTINERPENASNYNRENDLVGKIKLVLYADDIGVVNPIGYARGRHKMLLFHLDIDNQTKWRTKASQIPSVLMVERSPLLKGDGLKKILKPMIEDLKDLEVNTQKSP